MLTLLITVLIVFLILAIAWWALQQMPLPEPFRWVTVALIAIIAIVVLIQLLPDAGNLRLRSFAGVRLCAG